MKISILWWILGLLLLFDAAGRSWSANTTKPGAAPNNSALQNNVIQLELEPKVPERHVPYAIPPFAVKFQTLDTLTGNADLDDVLLESEVAHPCKEILSSFFQSSFTQIIHELKEGDEAQRQALPSLAFEFTSLDFQVIIHYRSVQQLEETNDMGDSSSSPSNGRGSQEQDEMENKEENKETDHMIWLLEFYAEFVGAAFFKPDLGEDGSFDGYMVPSSSHMSDLILGWMHQSLQNSRQIAMSFQNNPSPLMNNIRTFEIETGIRVFGRSASPFDDDDDESSTTSTTLREFGTWNHAVMAAVVILLLLIAWLVTLKRRRAQSKREKER